MPWLREKGGPYNAATAMGLEPRDAMRLLKEFGFLDSRECGPRNTNGLLSAGSAGPGTGTAWFTVTPEEVDRCHRRLVGDAGAMARLFGSRGWTAEAICALKIGMDETHVTFPELDEYGTLVGFTHYQPNKERLGENGKKSLAAPGSQRVPFPAPESLDIGEDEPLLLVEGQPDATLAMSLGLKAVGIPGVNSWKREWVPRFTSMRVVVMLDADTAGRQKAREIAKDLAGHASDVRVIDPFPDRDDGSDLTDLVLSRLRERRDRADFEDAKQFILRMASLAEVVERPKPAPPTAASNLRVNVGKRPAPPDEAASTAWPASLCGRSSHTARRIRWRSSLSCLLRSVRLSGEARTSRWSPTATTRTCS